MDRFLFAELMEDEECSKEVLEIILGKEISLLSKDQTEKRNQDSYMAEVDPSGCLFC